MTFLTLFGEMNCRYFACPACRVYLDAGYRWAYWLLEDPGLVKMNSIVDVDAVAGCAEYWNPPDGERSEWLFDRILPAVRHFLNEHRAHGIVYTEEGAICDEDSIYFNWTEIET